MRQDEVLREYDPSRDALIASLEYEYPPGASVPRHAHGAAQLIHAIRGVMEVSAEDSRWVIPPQFALWLPARMPHSIEMARAVSMRTLYLRPRLVTSMRGCTVLHVSPLLRELIVEAVRLKRLRRRNRGESALVELITLELRRARAVPSFLRMPREKNALTVAQRICRDPSQTRTLAALCAEGGISVRTLERRFKSEVGCGFSEWRRQVRLMRGIELLAVGQSVKEVAYTVGYSQPSAFIEAFRLRFGKPPRGWVAALRGE